MNLNEFNNNDQEFLNDECVKYNVNPNEVEFKKYKNCQEAFAENYPDLFSELDDKCMLDYIDFQRWFEKDFSETINGSYFMDGKTVFIYEYI